MVLPLQHRMEKWSMMLINLVSNEVCSLETKKPVYFQLGLFAFVMGIL